jgi:hypothetical protein
MIVTPQQQRAGTAAMADGRGNASRPPLPVSSSPGFARDLFPSNERE